MTIIFTNANLIFLQMTIILHLNVFWLVFAPCGFKCKIVIISKLTFKRLVVKSIDDAMHINYLVTPYGELDTHCTKQFHKN